MNNRSHPPLRGVIFDLDGLLLDTERIYCTAWRKAARSLGFELSETVFSTMVGRTGEELRKVLTTWFGPEFPFERAIELRGATFTEQVTIHGISPKPGSTVLLADLKNRGIPCVVATGTERLCAIDRLERAGIPVELFRDVVSGPKVRDGKPDPAVFQRALTVLGLKSEETVALEDSLPGARAAAAAGVRVLIVPDLGEVPRTEPEWSGRIYENLYQVRDALFGSA